MQYLQTSLILINKELQRLQFKSSYPDLMKIRELEEAKKEILEEMR